LLAVLATSDGRGVAAEGATRGVGGLTGVDTVPALAGLVAGRAAVGARSMAGRVDGRDRSVTLKEGTAAGRVAVCSLMGLPICRSPRPAG